MIVGVIEGATRIRGNVHPPILADVGDPPR
jgi:hypothetical protein